jgi:hypothetical protein
VNFSQQLSGSRLVDSGTVDIRIDEQFDELRLLARWLRGEDEFRGRVDLVERTPVPGQMGGIVDALTVVVTSGTATTLVSSVFAWLRRRKETNAVTLKFRNANGNELELACGSGADAEKLLTQVRVFFDDGA